MLSFRSLESKASTSVSWAALTLAAVLSISAAMPRQAAAQNVSPVTPTGKGMIGLGLIGAELGLVIPAIAGARETWPYIVFPLVGAAGGAVAGFFVEDATKNSPEIDVALMVAGVALIIPAVVGTLALTSNPPEGSDNNAVREDPNPTPQGDTVDTIRDDQSSTTLPSESGAPPTDAQQPTSSVRVPRRPTLPHRPGLLGGPGLFRVASSQLLLGVPVAQSVNTFTDEEIRALRLTPSRDVIIPVFSGEF